MNFNQYIVYVDESGDHNLTKVDPNFPVFVLSLCVFQKNAYCDTIIPAIQKFKFKYFGHDMTILHEREIRKAENEFKILVNKDIREPFYSDLNKLVEDADFSIISSVIRKDKLDKQADNPYHTALLFCLEALFDLIPDNVSYLHIVFEKRGKSEDRELELEFRRICDGENIHMQKYPFIPIFASKSTNSTGLQLADMVARPIGVKELKPDQSNRAYDIIEPKFYKIGEGFKDVSLMVDP